MTNRGLSSWTRLQAVCWSAALAWLALDAGTEASRALVAAGVGLSVLSLALVLRAPRALADVVTLGRAAAVVAALAAPWWLGDESWLVWSLLVAASTCDLFDGALARARGATAHGAILDMEVDQLSVLAMSALFVCGGGATFALLLPALRYAYVLASWPAKLPATDPKPRDGDNRRAKQICAAVVISLLLALMPGFPAAFGDAVTAVAAALLTWSFAGDWVFLLRRGRAEAGS